MRQIDHFTNGSSLYQGYPSNKIFVTRVYDYDVRSEQSWISVGDNSYGVCELEPNICFLIEIQILEYRDEAS